MTVAASMTCARREDRRARPSPVRLDLRRLDDIDADADDHRIAAALEQDAGKLGRRPGRPAIRSWAI